MVTPSQLKGIDTLLLCRIMDMDTVAFRKRVNNLILRNGYLRPGIFEASLSKIKFASIQENLFRFDEAFYLQERPIRSYPNNCGANIVGYVGEVDSNYLKKHTEEGYQSGDYAGMTGMESSYEKALMGERGIQILLRDKNNKVVGPYNNSVEDVMAVAGNNLFTSLDIELQLEGEKLMTNKVGAIVAIDPRTGGILALVSAPTYSPDLLTGSERRKHYSELLTDPRLPLLNRGVSTYYPPGSTFKTLQALVALHEGVITPATTFSCNGAFHGCGKPMKCLDPGTFKLDGAITLSCNTYFANVMQRVINNPKYPNVDSSLTAWAHYMNAFGLGNRLGVDLPNERSGLIPTPKTYNRMYPGMQWNFCTFRSVSIGQGEVLTTPLQVANEMAYLANKGWFITPHIVDSIEGGDKFNLLDKYGKKHFPLEIPDAVFEEVHNGMQGVVDRGTGRGAQVPGISVCGKTGTAENFYKGKQLEDHSFFAAFAPRENPKIAIMVICENAGFGGTWAAPIAGLMIEKYLNDTIAAERKPIEDRMTNAFLIPPQMLEQMRVQDSIEEARKEAILSKTELKNIQDTLQTDDVPDEEELKTTAPVQKQGNEEPAKKEKVDPKMILPGDRKRNSNQKDTLKS
jgi:penicillin-binding protein 2